MIVIRQNNDEYLISFRYDPKIVELVKNVPSRTWHPDSKYWSIQKEKLGFLINQFKGTEYENDIRIFSEENLNENSDLESTYTIPDIELTDPFYVKEGATPYKHQLDFMKYAIDRQNKGNTNGFILADEQGLSKSAEVINLGLYNKHHNGFKHCLIICCINTAKFTWQNEIDIHTKGEYSGYIIGTRLKRDRETEKYDGSSKQKYDDLISMKKYSNATEDPLPYFIVMNIESLRYKEGKTYPITDRIIEMINSGQINMVALDEIHKNTSPQSIQGKQVLRIKKSTKNNAEWIPMTGTPIINKPTDVFLPLKLVNGHDSNSYWQWCQEFCLYGGYGGYEIVGYKNIPKLKAMLQGNMIRRLKKDVLDLPPKIQYTEYVENTTYQEKLYRSALEEVLSEKDTIIHSLNPMVKFLRLRQINGSPEIVDEDLIVDKHYLKCNAKLVRLLELLEDIHERGEKVIIFSNWVEPLRTLYKFVSKRYKVCCYTGTMSSVDRESNKKTFLEDPDHTVMIGTIGAMGVSVTLTCARNVIFYDEPWTPADKEQAEDRIYRIGTTQSVNIYTLLTKNTIDEKVHDILYTKKGISKYIIDNNLDIHNNPKLFDLLLQNK